MPKDFKKNPPKVLEGPIVLQITEVKDVHRSQAQLEQDEDLSTLLSSELIDNRTTTTATTTNNKSTDSARLLRITLTDGHTSLKAIEYRHIPELSSAKVGTKLLIHNASLKEGWLLLEPSSTTVLGGSLLSTHRVISRCLSLQTPSFVLKITKHYEE